MPESETEKHGISLGSRFSDKARHVPIKKRRLILRSPSPPPPETSPCAVETADQKKSQDASNKFVPLQSSSSNMNLSQTVDTNNSIGAKKTTKSNKRFYDDDDFSGISIVAAAACSSSLGKDCGYAEDGSGIEVSSALERAREVSNNTETHLSCKALSKDDIFDSSEMSSGATSSCISVEPVGEHASLFTIGNTSQQGESVGKGLKDASLGEDCLTFSDEIVRNQRPSSRANRLHWDLNVVMDDWEQPFDDPCAQNDFARNVSQDVGKLNHNGSDTETEGHNLLDDTEIVHAAQCCLLPGELRASVNRSTSEINDKLDMDVGFNLKQSLCLGEKSFSSKANFNLDVMNCLIEDTKCGRQRESSNPTDELIIASQRTQPPTLTLNETEDASVMSLDDICIGYQPVMEGLKSNVDVSSYQSQNCVTFDSVADTHIASCVSSNSDTPSEVKQNVVVPEVLESSKNFNCEGNSVDDVDLKTVDPQGHPEIGIPEDNSLPGTEAANSFSKRFSVDVADADADGELQEDYDFQYEDGELRESSGCAWEEYDGMDREGVVADYVSNNKETHISNPIDYHVSVSRQVDNRENGRVIISPAASSVDSIVDNQVYR